MYFKVTIILSVFILLATFSTSSLSVKPSNTIETIVFHNFNKKITLIKKNNYYQRVDNGEQFKLSNRLIVKTTKNVSSPELYHPNPLVTSVRPLFTGQKNNYYLLELKNESSLSIMLNVLQEKEGVLLVQPDILQIGSKVTVKKNRRKINNTAENSLEKNWEKKHRREERTQTKIIAKTKNMSPYIALLDIHSLWSKTKGKGVKIAIIDDGFNLQHSDLLHITPTFSYDSETKTQSYLPDADIDVHGTKVAGIIFAAHNKAGINGIAPEADLIALRQPDTWTSNTLLSFQLAKLAGASIINCSWHSEWLLQPITDVVNELTQYGRDGKGIAIVFSAGNRGIKIAPGSNESAIESALVVGASDENFERLSFSNYGQSVDLETYGKGVKTTLVSGQYGVFAGTSLAAAIVSGLSALLLSQYPEMTLEQLDQQLKLITKSKPMVESS